MIVKIFYKHIFMLQIFCKRVGFGFKYAQNTIIWLPNTYSTNCLKAHQKQRYFNAKIPKISRKRGFVVIQKGPLGR